VTWLARRAPHPQFGMPVELWSFECHGCGHVQNRTVQPDGTPADFGFSCREQNPRSDVVVHS
jgi:hypothetical protein